MIASIALVINVSRTVPTIGAVVTVALSNPITISLPVAVEAVCSKN